MQVRDVMTSNVVTIDKDRKLSDAIRILQKKKISRIVVTDSGKVCGVVTEKDIVKVLGSSRHRKLLPSSLHVSTAMQLGLIVVVEDAEVSEAARLMVQNKIDSLPVVKGEKLVGIVTPTDLLELLLACREKLDGVMSRPVITVLPSDRIVHARRLMLDNGIGRVVVAEGDEVVGILSQRDLMIAFGMFRKAADSYQRSRIRNILVGDVMTQHIKTLDASATVARAAKLMLEDEVSGIPIVQKGRLVGIVTKSDLVRLLI